MNKSLLLSTIKTSFWILVAIILCRVTKGYFAPVLMVVGVIWALSNKTGLALCMFALFPFLVNISPQILPKENPLFAMSLRGGVLLIGLSLALVSVKRVGRLRLPFATIVPYMLVAGISSMSGWAPTVSYLKMVNFILYLVGIWYGTQNLQRRPSDIETLRHFFMGMSFVLIIGSIALIPFPAISYATSLSYVLAESGVERAEEVFRALQADGMQTLFCGITSHSQALAPLLVCDLGWLLCDMLFVERRFDAMHLILILLGFPLLYMTRSRVAFFSSAVMLVIVYFYAGKKVSLPGRIKARLAHGMLAFIAMMVVGAVVLEIRSDAISGWMRKTNNVQGDYRSLGEAITASRMGVIEQNMYDFHRNPLLGSGFQVAERTAYQVAQRGGFALSAPIEKGVLPAMVLGETGVVGAVVFGCFVLAFLGICTRRRYYITITMLLVFFATNMGEATFFSPGGVGGMQWMFCIVGGFVIDTVLLTRRDEGTAYSILEVF